MSARYTTFGVKHSPFVTVVTTHGHIKFRIISFYTYNAFFTYNVVKIFMRLVDKHFLRHYEYYKLPNRNKIKFSYSCMPSMNNVILKHSSKIMEDPNVFLSIRDELVSKCWHRNKCTLNCFKDR